MKMHLLWRLLCTSFILSIYGAELEVGSPLSHGYRDYCTVSLPDPDIVGKVEKVLFQRLSMEHKFKIMINSAQIRENTFERLRFFDYLLSTKMHSNQIPEKVLKYREDVMGKIIRHMARSHVKLFPVDAQQIVIKYLLGGITLEQLAPAKELMLERIKHCYMEVEHFPEDFKPVCIYQIARPVKRVYSMLDVLKLLLYKKATVKKSSGFCWSFLLCCGCNTDKENSVYSVMRTYEEIEQNGWGEVVLYMEFAILIHCIYYLRDESPEKKVGVDVFLPPYYHRYCRNGVYWNRAVSQIRAGAEMGEASDPSSIHA